jgi:hypothetical protein
MAEIIPLHKNASAKQDDLITTRPWEFRRAPWRSSHFIQAAKADWHGLNGLESGLSGAPPHFVLNGSLADTILGMYNHRNNADRMKEAYYLAGLIDCLINQVNPLLRTFLINDIYKKISLLKGLLNLNWYGHIDMVLLPISPRLYNREKYREGITNCRTLKDLYTLIRKGTGEMFDILSEEYVFFAPGEGHQ